MIRETDFASDVGKVPFGLDRVRAVEALRRLADEIESGRTVLTKVMLIGTSEPGTFTGVRLALMMHDCKEPKR